MSLCAIGLSHATAPVEVREKVVFAPELLPGALRDLVGARYAREAAILSTCNRTEVYINGGEAQAVTRWLERVHRVPADTLAPYVYMLHHDKAVAHVFRVASGLESMVLGEPQVLGQLKHAVRTADASGALGLVLNRLFQRTFAVAKDVRTRTDIGTASISMAAAAVKLAQRIFSNLVDQRVLLIGAGEMIELAATHFAAQRPKSITVANRTFEHGEKLADRLGAVAITLTELPDRLPQFDIIVTCTGSSLPIIGKGMLERAVKQRQHVPMFIADLAVPRDVEPEARHLNDVFLYNLDDLTEIVRDNVSIRRTAVAQAERMIAEQTTHFLHWLEGRTIVPTIAALSRHHDGLRASELERARRLLASGASPEQTLDELARRLTKKLLHAPLTALNAANGTQRAELVAALAHVYQPADPCASES
jgi:glutamyl-tRNA reductase